MKVTYFNKTVEVKEGTRLIELLDDNDKKKYYCANVDNRLRELNYILPNKDCKVEFLDLCNSDAVLIYQNSLRYLFAMAVNRLYKKVKVVYNYSVSRAIFANISGINGPVNPKVIDTIQAEMNDLIQKDLPIKRYSTTVEEAKKIYNSLGYHDKSNMLDYRPEDTVHMYKCDNYLNYMFGYMVPSTGYITKFNLMLYFPGLIIQYPRAELNGEIPEFTDEKIFSKTLRAENEWGNIIKASSIWQMNKLIEAGQSNEFINICETKHNNMLAELGYNIKKDPDIRLIAIAGPSSSGKTTFCNRLRVELLSRGIRPVMISLDNYYLDKSLAPLTSKGEPDLEHIEALDIERFDQDMYALINGEEVTLPLYNFKTGKREVGETVKLEKGQPVMIEGIHALNERLTPSIPSNQKYKIFIAPTAQYHIDSQNPISMSDIRLIRRLVRDYKYRNASAEETLKMWDNVRAGEFTWIYPTQSEANYVFNSELTYELCVMKKYAMKVLQEVEPESNHYITANRLIKFLKYFKDIPDKWIPCNSILREFIGGSIFYDN